MTGICYPFINSCILLIWHKSVQLLHVQFLFISQLDLLVSGAIIRLGSSHLFRFNDPGEAARLRQEMKNVSEQMLADFLSPVVACICYY